MSALAARMPPCRGYSLAEIMVAMALGLLIIAALVTLFEEHRISQKQNQAVSTLQDNARFALHVLARDLLMSGHWGGPPGAAYVSVDAATTALAPGTDCGA